MFLILSGLSENFTIRLYQAGDEKDIVPLLELVFNGWPRLDLGCAPLDHWIWKYRDNPSSAINIIVATSEDGIIGCDHAIQKRIKIGGEVHLCSLTGDVAVHPDYRNTGVWKKMIDFRGELRAKTGVRLNYFMTGNPVVVKSISKTRPQFPHSLTNLVRIRDIDHHMRSIPTEKATFVRFGFRALKLTNRARYSLSRRKLWHDIDIVEVNSFDDKTDEFWRQVSGGYSFIAERSCTYLNWMYCDPRGGNFAIRQAVESGRIVGYVVLSINKYRGDYPVGFVVDLLTLPDRLDVAEMLATSAGEYFDERGVNIVNYLVIKGHPYSGLFRRLGFLDSRVKFHLFYRTKELSERMRDLKKRPPSDVMFTWGDHDTLPVEAPR